MGFFGHILLLGNCGFFYSAFLVAMVTVSEDFFFLQLDLSRSIELQGPLDAIIHKLSDDVVNGAENGDEYARKCFKNFQV